ncbi:hypothetical protein RND81_07G016300 [Saponaria officinalis]|uniref:RING-type E3 ubiquitin transferase n=1 Tax=Saponaria officinalis TaxID=3572 RepID=A0AAW1JLW2_SAPOF
MDPSAPPSPPPSPPGSGSIPFFLLDRNIIDGVVIVPSFTGELKTVVDDLHAFECPVCLMGENQDAVKEMTCGHRLHEQCLIEWLHTAQTCPVCRDEPDMVYTPSLEEIAGVGTGGTGGGGTGVGGTEGGGTEGGGTEGGGSGVGGSGVGGTEGGGTAGGGTEGGGSGNVGIGGDGTGGV